MKKITSLVLVAILSLVVFVGCGAKKDSAAKGLEKVKEAGVLKIGLSDDYPPMEFRDDKNKLVGFDVDISKALAEKLGVKAEFVPTSFNGIVVALNSGKFDSVISAVSITDERKKQMEFVGPYIEGGQIVIVKKENDTIKSSKDLKGKIVACQMGSTGEEAAKKIEGTKELKKYDKVTEALQDLAIGRSDALVVDGQVGRYYMKKNASKYKVLKDKLTVEPQGIGVKKGNEELKEGLDKAFKELKDEGKLSEISKKWFGTDIYKK
ncbi:ABC transporter substrate-binding protein [Clostridium oceanicum]|uniref:ABC transporter substrate-binding protein n=1 Tax=Clostridium oceanicum TaxID=1543 RepID=A0ABN1JTE6_9CLOT